jgi:hypothetical protein
MPLQEEFDHLEIIYFCDKSTLFQEVYTILVDIPYLSFQTLIQNSSQ